MKKLTLTLIRFYQNYLSGKLWGSVCRYTPSCSEYTYQAISSYGIIKGSFLGIKRISSCHPFSQGGFDPVK